MKQQISQSKKVSTKIDKLLNVLQENKKNENPERIQDSLSELILSTSDKENDLLSILDCAVIVIEEIGLGVSSVISLFNSEIAKRSGFNPGIIEKKYGKSVRTITEGLIKISDFGSTTSSSQAENFRKLLLNLAKDVRVILIRLAVQLEIMRKLKSLPNEIQIKIALEASYLYAPLAHRLGLYNIKTEMEDLSLKYTERQTYSTIAKKLDETMKARKQFIQEFIQPIEDSLKKQNFSFDIKGRPKSIHSIWNKMKKKEVEFEDIYDLFAIRIILNSDPKNEKSDCWQVYSTVTDIYQPNPLRLRDWISVPKTNGYESLHTTVIGPEGRWVEVQIRTERMNEIAEKGFAAHWKYKGVEGEQGLEEWLVKIREILETPEPDAAEFIDDFKLSLYSKEIFIFTPKGDLRKFPAGATVLDFAYDIHTDVGSTCTGAKVNGKNVPIRYVLQNGDRVEILRSKNQNPKMDWLNFVVTSKAKSKIKQRLNEEKAKEAENGKEIIKRRFKNWKIAYDDDVIRRLMKKFRQKTAQDFYFLVANEKIDLTNIKEFLTETPVETAEPVVTETEEKSTEVETSVTGKVGDYLLIDEQVANIDYKLAKCCNPIFGDAVFGFVTVSEGIKIHRMHCPNAAQLISKYNYRIVKAKWTKTDKETSFPVEIKISGEETTGILNDISDVISKDSYIHMRGINLDSDKGVFEGKIKLLVKDLQHLDSVIARLSMVKGVYKVTRIEGMA
ncbi:MAG: bifunctional (p)ppGpp synthetase/guanosine-3',5'-bis(diphosphate) 3'-pyrophosphohydrolase [Bacteroidales bacterium]|nr:bifunctional (p)ppGpp synthetase/guanosine-3',5'-bis(diphosphate) 3'-pyrophosphohydrolase [Bacteroidales bacterium]